MTGAPVPAVLTLWSLGHSSTDIAKRLGTKARTVSLIVEQARDIGDKRAVLHVGKSGKPIGRPNKDLDPDVEAVPAITAPVCLRGHPRTPENLSGDSKTCRICRRARDLFYREARRA